MNHHPAKVVFAYHNSLTINGSCILTRILTHFYQASLSNIMVVCARITHTISTIKEGGRGSLIIFTLRLGRWVGSNKIFAKRGLNGCFQSMIHKAYPHTYSGQHGLMSVSACHAEPFSILPPGGCGAVATIPYIGFRWIVVKFQKNKGGGS